MNPACLICVLLLIVCGAESPASEIRPEQAPNLVVTAVSNFCAAYRPDLSGRQRECVIRLTSSNGVAAFFTDEGREIFLTVSLEHGDVTSFSAFHGFSRKSYSKRAGEVAPSEDGNVLPGDMRARSILQGQGFDTNMVKLIQSRQFRLGEHSKQPLTEYVWQRQLRGFLFKDDFVRMIFDAHDGELLGFAKTWEASPKSLKANYTLAKAKELVLAHFASDDSAARELTVKSAELGIISPNDFLSKAKSFNHERRLAWILKLPKQLTFRNSVELWIDAETGVFLGGLDLL